VCSDTMAGTDTDTDTDPAQQQRPRHWPDATTGSGGVEAIRLGGIKR
jgi:hypothetical protein